MELLKYAANLRLKNTSYLSCLVSPMYKVQDVTAAELPYRPLQVVFYTQEYKERAGQKRKT